MKKKNIYTTPSSIKVDVNIEQNILLDISTETTMGGGSALVNTQRGEWGNLWKE